jgi:hypothetical protein
MTIPAGETGEIVLVMSNMVAGRFAQEAQLYIDLESRLIEKSVVLEGRAAAGPVTATETQAGETPATETQAGETPAGETQAGESRAGETRAGETRADDATAEGADNQDSDNPADAATTAPAEVSSSTKVRDCWIQDRPITV